MGAMRVLVALSAVSFTDAFGMSGPAIFGRSAMARLHAGVAVSQRSHVRRQGALRLRAADLSMEVSDTPPDKDPLEDVPTVAVYTADGCTACLPFF